MSRTHSTFDSKLRELEMDALPPIDQMDTHWKLFRNQLQAPSTPAPKALFKHPFFYGLAVIIVTGITFLLFKLLPAKDNSSAKPISNDSISLPPINQNAVVQDTLPIKKVETKATQTSPIKRVNTKVIVLDSIGKGSSPDTSQKTPVKKIYGVTTRTVASAKKDSIRLELPTIDKTKVQDTVHFIPIKQKSNSTHRVKDITKPFETKQTSHEIAVAVYPTINTQEKISVVTIPTEAIKEVKHEDYLIISDTNRFQNLQQVLEEPYFKGKVVYIDLWGTRCGPCIEQFKHIKALKEKYSGKDLVFLYLKSPYSFDDSKEWKSMIYKYNLSGMNVSMSIGFYTEHYWKKYSNFYKEDRLFGIPTYLIVNKKGEIVDYDAPRPGSGHALYEKLDKVLAN